jgi:hypothetical protein
MGWRARPGSRLAVFVLVAAVLFGCGVKAPPVPPRLPPLPGVADLAYRLADGVVALDWRVDGPLTSGQARKAAMVTDPACETCPLIYDKVATLPFRDTPGQRFSTELPVDPGYRYTFKVQLEAGTTVGKQAGPIAFDLPAEDSNP